MSTAPDSNSDFAGSPAGVWILALVIFFVGSITAYVVIDPYSEKHHVEAQQKAERYTQYRVAEENLKQSKEKGAQALDDADNAIRQEATERRTSLEKASIRTTMSNQHGVRIDRYFLKGGKVITCTTTISGNTPAMFNCDGNL